MQGVKKKLGILIAAAPGSAGFEHGVRLADAGLRKGVEVYLYLIDRAVLHVAAEQVQALRHSGARLYACAFSAQRQRIAIDETAIFCGLTIVNDMFTGTDRFVAFT